MSLKNIDTSEKNVAVLEIAIEKPVFDEAVTKIFRKNAPKMTVPGFRRGKAPRSIIEKMYGKGVFYEDALNELVPNAVSEAITESKVKSVSRPEIDVKSIDEDGVLFTAKVYTKPEVEVKNYTGLEATKTVITVTDEDVNSEIERARKRNARSIQVTDRAAENGDDVIIDFEGFVDGVPFEGGKAVNHNLKLGSGQFIPGFEEQVIGKNIDESFDVEVTFPAEYQSEDLAGKAAVFKVTLHEIKYEELPEVDDEFIKDISTEFDTVEEYKADVKNNIAKRNDQRAETAVEEQLVDGILANFEADIPEVMIENETDNQLQDYSYRLQQQGIDMKLYMQYTGMDINQMREQFKVNAERHVKTRLALEKIVELENIEATEEDLNEEFDKISKAYSMEIDKVKENIDVNVIKEDLCIRKAVEFVRANAQVTTVEKTAEELRKEREEAGEANEDEELREVEEFGDFVSELDKLDELDDENNEEHIHDENCNHDKDEE